LKSERELIIIKVLLKAQVLKSSLPKLPSVEKGVCFVSLKEVWVEQINPKEVMWFEGWKNKLK
jgi:hypothetical protein